MKEEAKHILAGRLIDGSGGRIRHNQLISINAGRISDIREVSEAEQAFDRVTDLSRFVVLPVLLDTHVHLCMSGSIDAKVRERQLGSQYQELVPVIGEHLRHHFSHGVLAVRDGGDRSGSLLRYLREHNDARTPPVSVQTPGTAYHQAGRYGSLIGTAPAAGESLKDLYQRMNQQTGLVKVVQSGINSLQEFGLQTAAQFSDEELRELVSRAKRDGCRVMVHANGEKAVKSAIEAGCDSIEHGFFMGRDNLQRLVEHGTCWVPTVFTMKACAQYAEFYRGAIDKKVVDKILEHQLEQLRLAHELGVEIVLGTDSGSIGVLHGEALVEEMKLFIQAGLSLTETIGCATARAARLLGLDDELGQIAVGQPAHFLVTRGTPSQLPRKLTNVEAIYLHGRPSELYRRDPEYANLRKPYKG